VRKPTSRAAREAQRKLNHSIIEKVRRTKINDALAMLRSIVPVDYGQPSAAAAVGVVGDEGGREVDKEGTRSPPRGGGKKKEEKEKEYKLEILVRTVSFVQDLLEKVRVLERDGGGGVEVAVCEHCGGRRKRKRMRDDEDDEDTTGYESADDGSGPTDSSSCTRTTRLPSISSWLPPLQQRQRQQHLPSPPSSTPADPINPSHLPPLFKLTSPTMTVKTATPPTPTTSSTSPVRTPEDESVASLLLQIRNSPPTVYSVSTAPESMKLPEAARFVFGGGGGSGMSAAETPGSLLGMDLGHLRTHRVK
jgi:hypothetical protein